MPAAFHSAIGRSKSTVDGLIQPSIVKPLLRPTFKFCEGGTRTVALLPFSPKACPTLPGAKVTLPCKAPLFPSALSLALTSAAHQLTSPEAAGTQWVVE